MVLGTLKNASVLCPLFSAFGPDPVAQRMGLGNARVLVAIEALYRSKVAPIRDRLADLEHVLVIDERRHEFPGAQQAYSTGAGPNWT
ncbi:hypothetical protein [Streptomyces formicae]|uniref:Acetyl-coenzyme A synthetase n=1 Tax=Streptomyces formicae TaxID=1616117 RepID=A0A291QL17_9ACTN|nr:hypothetical protein [Streptomyces formicae]ATL32206.1 Acetyl-coenzyme A synthetase [Streptomyces formicae]